MPPEKCGGAPVSGGLLAPEVSKLRRSPSLGGLWRGSKLLTFCRTAVGLSEMSWE